MSLLYYTAANIKVIKNFIKEQEYSTFIVPVFICIGVVFVLMKHLAFEDPTLYYVAFQSTAVISSTVLLLSIYFPKVIYCICT